MLSLAIAPVPNGSQWERPLVSLAALAKVKVMQAF
jgi:hypothetical protein